MEKNQPHDLTIQEFAKQASRSETDEAIEASLRAVKERIKVDKLQAKPRVMKRPPGFHPQGFIITNPLTSNPEGFEHMDPVPKVADDAIKLIDKGILEKK